MSASFETRRPVRFGHCDPAGILFFPRLFEMANEAVEDWFAEALDLTFNELHVVRGMGVPTARFEADFPAASRLGETLVFSVAVERIGRSSATLKVRARCEGELRFDARQTIVYVRLDDMSALPWPVELRGRMAGFQSTAEGA